MCARIDPAELRRPARLGRLLSRLERDPADARKVLASLPDPPTGTRRIGITGSPGVGKSTLLNRLIRAYRAAGERVAVVAVDPTSPLSGGAVLADRLRMEAADGDPEVFIRSMGSRGSLGGVTPAASGVAAALEAAGYTRVLIETVGVGQTGYDIVCLADTVAAVFSPEGGDGVQLLKAGVLEVGDVFVVNKADRPGAELMQKEIRLSLELGTSGGGTELHHGQLIAAGSPAGQARCGWETPVISVSAECGAGTAELHAALEAHGDWLASLPEEHPRRRLRLARELNFVLKSQLADLLATGLAGRVDELATQVASGGLELWQAAETLRADLRQLF